MHQKLNFFTLLFLKVHSKHQMQKMKNRREVDDDGEKKTQVIDSDTYIKHVFYIFY